ncbi:MAG: hypothetical protein KIT24_10780 [Phycisphaeraceae bacterium]|nr:hypothetical protein [Phycisphaeraceae bacterium]
MLRRLADSKRNYVNATNKGGSRIVYDHEGNTWIGITNPGSPPMGRLGQGREAWEDFWHELGHAYRYDRGLVPNSRNIKPGNFDFSVEEFETVVQDNELRKWKAHCNPSSPERADPNLLDPLSHPAITQQHRNRLKDQKQVPLIPFGEN